MSQQYINIKTYKGTSPCKITPKARGDCESKGCTFRREKKGPILKGRASCAIKRGRGSTSVPIQQAQAVWENLKRSEGFTDADWDTQARLVNPEVDEKTGKRKYVRSIPPPPVFPSAPPTASGAAISSLPGPSAPSESKRSELPPPPSSALTMFPSSSSSLTMFPLSSSSASSLTMFPSASSLTTAAIQSGLLPPPSGSAMVPMQMESQPIITEEEAQMLASAASAGKSRKRTSRTSSPSSTAERLKSLRSSRPPPLPTSRPPPPPPSTAMVVSSPRARKSRTTQ